MGRTFWRTLGYISPVSVTDIDATYTETFLQLETFTYLDSILDEHGGSDADVKGEDLQSDGNIPTIYPN